MALGFYVRKQHRHFGREPRFDDGCLGLSSHVLFVVVTIWLLARLTESDQEGTALLNSAALVDLAAIAAAAGVAFLIRQKEVQLVYRLGAHVAFMALLLKELASMTDGQALVTIAWAAYALALLGLGLSLKNMQLRLAGLGSLAAVVAKLLLFDLSNLEAGWRILLFLGFGAIFLLLSYFFQSTWKPDTRDSAGKAAGPLSRTT
ncbi:MAG: DUF2339 domain-containing protein [Thermoleophilia bacterium]